jgi:hypothetical protein
MPPPPLVGEPGRAHGADDRAREPVLLPSKRWSFRRGDLALHDADPGAETGAERERVDLRAAEGVARTFTRVPP